MYQTDFLKDEFKRRRENIYQSIGDNALAVICGSEKNCDHNVFRQNNDFYYVCGVEVPHAYLLLDGREKKTTLFLSHQSKQQKEKEGEIMSAEIADTCCELTGVDACLGIESLAKYLEGVETLFTPMRQAEGPAMSWDTLQRAQQEIFSDPWDGRLNRTSHFLHLLQQRLPKTQLQDLSPVLDDLRIIKSFAELNVLRRAGKITALGIIEAMRSTRPGVMEYQLETAMRYHFLLNGARDAGYRAIIAGGPNAWYGHYNANNCLLKDGDLVLADGAPDYHYYTSDIGRMWPVNGKYTPVQKELYGFIVKYHKVFLSLIRPGVTDEEIRLEAAKEMAHVVRRTRFSKEIYQNAAERCLDFPYHMSHSVGMSVHDVGHYRGKILKPGIVFALDPQLIIPEEKRYIRVEDTVVVTEDGVENLTVDAPLELEEVEQLMKEEGILQHYPPLN